MNLRPLIAVAGAATLTLLGLGGVASLAQADERGETRTQLVRFADLNLGSEAGLQALYRRLENAADNVCGPESVLGSRAVSAEWRACVASAVRAAVLSIDRPNVTAYYAAYVRHRALAVSG